MMNVDLNLNDVQSLLVDYAKRHGVSQEKMDEDWQLSYRDRLKEGVEQALSRLLEAMQIHRTAVSQGDDRAALAGLVEAKVAASHLRDDSGDLEADLLAAIRLSKTELPERYVVPEHYGYKAAGKSKQPDESSRENVVSNARLNAEAGVQQQRKHWTEQRQSVAHLASLERNLLESPFWKGSFYEQLAEYRHWDEMEFWRLHLELVQVAKEVDSHRFNLSMYSMIVKVYVRISTTIAAHFDPFDIFKINNIESERIRMFRERLEHAFLGAFTGKVLDESCFDIQNPLIAHHLPNAS